MGHDEGELMKYRSSVTTFAKAALSEAAQWEGTAIAAFEQGRVTESLTFRDALGNFLASEERTFTKEAKKAIPEADWSEILDFISRYHDANGFRPTFHPWQSQRVLMPWLAAVAVCALDDIGR
jgi:hypothetical protein